jgi:predicted DNA binding CopG/RHH family protein
MKPSQLEKSLKTSIKAGDIKVLKLSKTEREGYREAARATLSKDKIITLRINGKDLNDLKQIALKSGKRYQTYIGELLHEHIVRRKKAA